MGADLREAVERVVQQHRQEQSEVINDLKAALKTPACGGESTAQGVLEDVIRELEFDNPVRWARVIERLRGL